MEKIAQVLTRHPPSDRRRAVLPAQMAAQRDLLSARAETLVSRPIVTCAPGDTVAEAARRMRDQLVSSLIVDSRPPGLVTARDLRDRVLAAGLDPGTPVGQVMTMPLHTVPADSTIDEVVLAMVDRGIHHLPLTRQGRLAGIVTDTDLLRWASESDHRLLLRRQLDRAAGPEELAASAREVTSAAARLVRAGTPAAEITRFVASAHDALYIRAARDGEKALGPPPCPYALLVLGSGARRESTLRTDQDHALVVADGAPPGADGWFAALAEHLAATLEHCGLVRCPGNIMATNPARRVPLRAWQEQFIRWMEEPDEDAVLTAATYFDFRQLHGELEAEAPLRRIAGQAAGNRRFLGRLAVAALWRRPPLGFLHHLRGDHGRIDLKAHGTAPIVDLARLLALEAGDPAVATTARLQVAADHGTAGTAATDLAAAFEYLQQLRLRHQAGRLAVGAAPDDAVPLAELTALQRRWLKDTAELLRTCQESVRIAYRTDLIS
jgi:CBS domain-containing protein